MFKCMMLHDDQCSDVPPNSSCIYTFSLYTSSFSLFLSSFPLFQYIKIAAFASELRRKTGIGLISVGPAAGSSVLEILVIAHGKVPFPIHNTKYI